MRIWFKLLSLFTIMMITANCSMVERIAIKALYPFDDVNAEIPYIPPAQVIEHDEEDYFAWEVPGPGSPIIYLHGNGTSLTAVGSLLVHLSQFYHVYAVEYPGINPVPGEPSESSLENAALSLYQYVESVHPDKPVTIIGRSLGAAVAAQVADLLPPAKLILISPFSSFADAAGAAVSIPGLVSILKQTDFYKANTYKTEKVMLEYEGPVLVIHGQKDSIIPLEQGRAVAKAAGGNLVILEEVDHNNVYQNEFTFMAIHAFINE